MKAVVAAAVAIGTCSIAGMAVACLSHPATPEGQVVFVPVNEFSHQATADGVISVESCRATDAGLVVAGRIEAPAGNITIAVTGGVDGNAGVRVGRQGPVQRPHLPSLTPDVSTQGHFRVIIPWARSGSEFMIQMAGDAASGSNQDVVACPQ